MNLSRVAFIALVLVAMGLAACAPAPAPTAVSTFAPPTATRVPPTNTAVPATVTPTSIPPTSIPPTATATPRPVAIKVSLHSTLGRILVDGDGRTLYLLIADNKGVSVCNEDCLKTWPAFLSPSKASAQEGVNAALIGVQPRKDGATQVTYNGWPLYYRVTDTKPGDTTGQGLDGVWFVVTSIGDPVRPPSLNTPEPYGK